MSTLSSRKHMSGRQLHNERLERVASVLEIFELIKRRTAWVENHRLARPGDLCRQANGLAKRVHTPHRPESLGACRGFDLPGRLAKDDERANIVLCHRLAQPR